jgi:hypothetical protein
VIPCPAGPATKPSPLKAEPLSLLGAGGGGRFCLDAEFRKPRPAAAFGGRSPLSVGGGVRYTIVMVDAIPGTQY